MLHVSSASSFFCNIFKILTENVAAVSSSLGVDTYLIGATRDLLGNKVQWMFPLLFAYNVLLASEK